MCGMSQIFWREKLLFQTPTTIILDNIREKTSESLPRAQTTDSKDFLPPAPVWLRWDGEDVEISRLCNGPRHSQSHPLQSIQSFSIFRFVTSNGRLSSSKPGCGTKKLSDIPGERLKKSVNHTLNSLIANLYF